MANKLTLNKLGLTKAKEIPAHSIEFNDQTIEIYSYLPMEKKIDMVVNIVSAACADGYFNTMLADIYFALYLIENYTNISFTDKQKENGLKTYEIIDSNGLYDKVLKEIDSEEYDYIYEAITDIASEYTKYINSFAGIMKNASADYGNMQFDAEKIAETLSDPAQLSLVKDIITKL